MEHLNAMRHVLHGALFLLGVFFLVNTFAGFQAQQGGAAEAVTAACAERGWPAEAVSIRRSALWGNLLGTTVQFELQPHDQGRVSAIHVTLEKPINLMGWRVAEYTEKP